MVLLDALVFVLTVFIGVFTIGLGILVGLNPFGVFLASTLSSLVYMWLSCRAGTALLRRAFPAAASKLEQRVDGSRARTLIDRWVFSVSL